MTTSIRWLKSPWFWALLTLLVFISGFVWLGLHFCLNASEWASWVQAVGSIIAILGSVGIASWQYNKSQAAERKLRQQELEDIRNQQLQARTIAVRNAFQLASYLLNAADSLVGRLEHGLRASVAEPEIAKFEQMRNRLDEMATSTIDNVAALTVLEISERLSSVYSVARRLGISDERDLPRVVPFEDKISLMRQHAEAGRNYLTRLTSLKERLDALCRDRSLPLENDDFQLEP